MQLQPGTSFAPQAVLAAIVQSSNDAIYSKDTDTTIISWNPAAELLYGYAADEAVGQSVSILIPPDRQGEERLILSQILRGERVDHYETQRLRKDGHIIDVEVTVSPLHSDSGEIVGASVIARDIRERKLAARALEVAGEVMEAADTAIRENTAMAVHDLRSPLGVMTGTISTLREYWDEFSDERKFQLLDMLERNGERILRLANDILMVATAELGQLKVVPERVDLSRNLKDLIGDFDFDVSLDAGHQAVAFVDPHHLARVVTNLLRNAHTHGAAPIAIAASRDGESVLITVSDQGVGVPEPLVSRLFEPFARGPSAGKTDSTGLGLAVARLLARANGGDAWYETNRPQGSCFLVRLPAA